MDENNNQEEESSLLFGSQEFSEEFTSAVGKLTINFSHLEFMLSMFAGMHMNTGYPYNELVLSEFSFRQLVNVATGLFNLYDSDKDERDKFKEIIKRATLAEQSRNTITHSFYAMDTKTKAIVRQKSVTRVKTGFRQQRQEITANTILCIALDIEEISYDLGDLIQSIDERWWRSDPRNAGQPYDNTRIKDSGDSEQPYEDVMIEVIIDDKQKYLSENYPFGNVPELTDERCCLHCNSVFKVGDYKVFKDEMNDELIYCPNAPDCDGTVIDWVPTDYLDRKK